VGVTPYQAAWAAHLKRQNIIPPNEQTFRHGWNAAIIAAEAIIAEKHDPCEPWLDPGDIIKALEIDVYT
jgi:hypothetical protein